MNHNLDLTKILKDCPKGTKLYSTIFGEVEFVRVYQNNSVDFIIEIKLSDNSIDSVAADGRYFLDFAGECTLFPSKYQRDWSKFTAKEKFDPKTLQPFDRVLGRDNSSRIWKCNFKCVGIDYIYCIPYNDDTKHLVGTTDEPSDYYRYWED